LPLRENLYSYTYRPCPLSLVDGADPIKASSVKVEGIIAADNPIVGKTSMPACKDKT
jgi:hypothetical protein